MAWCSQLNRCVNEGYCGCDNTSARQRLIVFFDPSDAFESRRRWIIVGRAPEQVFRAHKYNEQRARNAGEQNDLYRFFSPANPVAAVSIEYLLHDVLLISPYGHASETQLCQ